MKKIILSIGVAALVGASLASCGKGSDKTYTAEEKAFGDSIALAMGKFAGAQQNLQFNRAKATMDSATSAKYLKEDFLRGMKTVFDADTNSIAYYQGLQMGMQLISPIIGISNDAGYPVDRDKVFEAFKQVYMTDSITDENTNLYYGEYSKLMQKITEKMREKAEAAKAESAENKENIAKGEEYAKKMLAEGYSKTETGLVYKIENPGTGNKVTKEDKVSIRYKGSKIDGTVFDQTREDAYTSPAGSFVPGFTEALTLLGKGGKMTAVIPGNLAYGLDGAGNLIGPNETLVFEIEIVNIEAAK